MFIATLSTSIECTLIDIECDRMRYIFCCCKCRSVSSCYIIECAFANMNGIQISRHVFSVDDTIRTDFTEGGISEFDVVDGTTYTAALHTQYTTSFGYLAFVEGNVYIRCHGILVNHVILVITIVVEIHVIKFDRSRVFCGCHFFGLEVRLYPAGGSPEDDCIYLCWDAEFFCAFESASSWEDEYYVSLLFGKYCIKVVAFFQVGYGVSFRIVFCSFKLTVSS